MANDTHEVDDGQRPTRHSYTHIPAPQTPVRPGYRIDPKTHRPVGVKPAPQAPVRPGYHVDPVTKRPEGVKPAPQA